jgi:predicted O-methyltransferase YrrM
MNHKQTWTDVDRYVRDTLVRQDDALDAALRESAAAGLPSIAVSAAQGKFLMLLAEAMHARTILEIGTLGGYSTIWLARALMPGGRLVTLEANPKHAAVARRNVDAAGIGALVDILPGRAIETLPALEGHAAAPFDLIFIDADKPSIPDYFSWAVQLAHAGSVILVDNVVRDGELANPRSDDPNVQAVRRFHEQVGADARVSATTLQTVGDKGYDGFTLMIVT